ncbi:MAG: tRNA dihydrouridine synthase DusB [Burkholderiaceae bacterium]|nr:tRNA dihydrouridine synthase DusB [Burkholderiaceae bacterium]
MAGVTDRPFRQLCKRLGAGYAVSEMAASGTRLRDSVKTSRRIDHTGEAEPRAVQIAGADPSMMAEAARYNVGRGAQVIDINMGCPARKVCKVAAGSALMSDERLAVAIVDAVARAVDVPVTVKLRTGPTPAQRNAVQLARDFERAGAAMLAVHGRTRACGYGGRAEYATIAEVKAAVAIPVVANGDIDSPQAALEVLRSTGADAVMIGRAAQGRPWIFREIAHYLATGSLLAEPDEAELAAVLHDHLLDHYTFNGEAVGVRSARKHVGWYLARRLDARAFLAHFHTLESAEAQLLAIERYFQRAGGAANDRQFRRSDAA